MATTCKDRSVHFGGPMVKATLFGTKTQFRRPIKPQPTTWASEAPGMGDVGGLAWRGRRYEAGAPGDIESKCPHGRVGDRVWVREIWAPMNLDYAVAGRKEALPDGGRGVIPSYRADHIDPRGDGPCNPMPWRSPQSMPRWASRIVLEVTAVRVERVQEISYRDCLAEGTPPVPCYDDSPEPATILDAARSLFAKGWDAAWASRGAPWETNPWVWVVEFRVCMIESRVCIS